MTCVSPIHAEGEIDFSKIPEFFAQKLSISIFAGEILCSGIILFTFTLPIIVIVRGKNVVIAVLAIDFIVMGFLIAIQWLPYYFLIIFSTLIALMYAGKIRDLLTGR